MTRLVLALSLASACSAEIDGPGGADGAPPAPVDARIVETVDAARPADASSGDCPSGVPADFGEVTPLDLDQSFFDGVYGVSADLSQDPDHLLFVRLREGSGIFAGGVTPGTYAIEGDDTDYQLCSACVYIAIEAPETPWPLLMATSGKITIDSVGATVTGQIEALTFRQIEIVYDGATCGDPEQEWPCGNTGCSAEHCGRQVEDGDCQTAISGMSF